MKNQKLTNIDLGKRRTRPMIGRGQYGKSLLAHFDRCRVNWSAKPNKIKAAELRSNFAFR